MNNSGHYSPQLTNVVLVYDLKDLCRVGLYYSFIMYRIELKTTKASVTARFRASCAGAGARKAVTAPTSTPAGIWQAVATGSLRTTRDADFITQSLLMCIQHKRCFAISTHAYCDVLLKS